VAATSAAATAVSASSTGTSAATTAPKAKSRTNSVTGIESSSARCRSRLSYAARVIPWLIFAVVVIPLVVIAFVATRRRTAAGESLASDDPQTRALTEQEFADAEAYDDEWREQDKERHRQERLP
jgi:hypothetical protein